MPFLSLLFQASSLIVVISLQIKHSGRIESFSAFAIRVLVEMKNDFLNFIYIKFSPRKKWKRGMLIWFGKLFLAAASHSYSAQEPSCMISRNMTLIVWASIITLFLWPFFASVDVGTTKWWMAFYFDGMVSLQSCKFKLVTWINSNARVFLQV